MTRASLQTLITMKSSQWAFRHSTTGFKLRTRPAHCSSKTSRSDSGFSVVVPCPESMKPVCAPAQIPAGSDKCCPVKRLHQPPYQISYVLSTLSLLSLPKPSARQNFVTGLQLLKLKVLQPSWDDVETTVEILASCRGKDAHRNLQSMKLQQVPSVSCQHFQTTTTSANDGGALRLRLSRLQRRLRTLQNTASQKLGS